MFMEPTLEQRRFIARREKISARTYANPGGREILLGAGGYKAGFTWWLSPKSSSVIGHSGSPVGRWLTVDRSRTYVPVHAMARIVLARFGIFAYPCGVNSVQYD
jgi:hypothetical protein